jgi:hypothetical protein
VDPRTAAKYANTVLSSRKLTQLVY